MGAVYGTYDSQVETGVPAGNARLEWALYDTLTGGIIVVGIVAATTCIAR